MQILEVENILPLEQFCLHEPAHSNFNHEKKSSKGDNNENEVDDDFYKAHSSDDFLHLKEPCASKIISPRKKKTVRFADDCGLDLATFRVMTETSDSPAQINPAVIRRFRKAAIMFAFMNKKNNNLSAVDEISDDDGDELCANKKRATWKVDFIQPASEYLKFRETLEKNKIALENVILRNDSGKMLGTIKVANLCFEKKVFIRLTSDAWKSFADFPATFHSSASNLCDIFTFEIDIPINDEDITKIEFCVCYVADGGVEYWDSNNGQNYVLISPDY